ncbi:MAG: hypothetical protein CVU11_10155 [Bacteroidetes bacterium HGW-Bacteroidetes-6]|jgi:hypothetical protein|nr:MAG: hypothetical protein CVU11_10155 [Bacteroidetes bacterium HGW-Bacteroidetes-6]
MEIIKCQFCDQDISANARICPFCGNKQHTKGELRSISNQIIIFRYIVGSIGLLLIAYAIAWWLSIIVFAVLSGITNMATEKLLNKYKPYELVEMLKKKKKSFFVDVILFFIFIAAAYYYYTYYKH